MISTRPPRPAPGDLVERPAKRLNRRRELVHYVQKGRVLAVVDDERALGGWVALVRWNRPRPATFAWEAVEAFEFSEGVAARVRVVVRRRSGRA